MRKYGIENFEICELYQSISGEDICEIEKFFIKQFNSINPKIGYNQTEGGEGGRPTEEVRMKISLAKQGVPRPDMIGKKFMLGYRFSEEQKQKISKRIQGIGNPFYGKQHSQESKVKFRQTLENTPEEIKLVRYNKLSESKQKEWDERSEEKVKEFGNKVSTGHKNRSKSDKEITFNKKSENWTSKTVEQQDQIKAKRKAKWDSRTPEENERIRLIKSENAKRYWAEKKSLANHS
jgi:hypothetical protein